MKARQVWERLVRKPWVNPDASFELVMAELAAGHAVDDLLLAPDWAARSPYRPPLSPIPPGDRYLIDELTAAARAPFEDALSPEPPNVDLGRIVTDFERTTGGRLDLAWRYEAFPHVGSGRWRYRSTAASLAGQAGRCGATPRRIWR